MLPLSVWHTPLHFYCIFKNFFISFYRPIIAQTPVNTLILLYIAYCLSGVRITDRKPRMPILQGFPRFPYAYWLYFGSFSLMEY